MRFFLLLFLAPFLLRSEQGFYSTRAYRIPSAVEQGANSIVNIVMYDPQMKYPLSSGTGFVVEDHFSLWTAAHVLGDGIRIGQKLFFKLYDNVGREVFSSSPTATATLAVLAEDYYSNALTLDKDFAKVTLNLKLPMRPLSIAASRVTPGTEVYITGFPALDNIATPSETSLGGGLMQSRVSYGQVLPSEQSDSKLLVIDGDGYFGQSGSPIFNESGEVLGIFTAIRQRTESGPGVQISRKGLGPSFFSIQNAGKL